MIGKRVLAISASAGSGKTFQLANRFIGLLATGERPSSILAATFTRKAAGEILERVLRLLSVAASGGEAQLAELRKHADASLTRERCAELLGSMLADPSSLSVGTLDGFLMRLALSLELDGSEAPGWSLIAEETDAAIRSRAAELALDHAEGKDLAPVFTMLHRASFSRSVHEAMLRAVGSALDAHRRVESGWLGAGEPSPDADEVETVVAALRQAEVPKSGSNPDKRFTSAAAKLVEQITAGEWREAGTSTLMKAALGDEPAYYKKPFGGTALAEALERAADLVGRAIAAELGARNEAVHELTRLFEDRYEMLKVLRGARRFDDIPRMLLRQGELDVLEHLYFRLDGEYRHVLLDEFQDTSIEQYRMLERMIEEFAQDEDPVGGSAPRSVFIVGDPKQSLYTWRNAEPGLLGALPELVHGLKKESLEVSWRSSPAIMDAVNTVFGGLAGLTRYGEARAVKRWLEAFEPHKAAGKNKDLGGLVTLSEHAGADKRSGYAAEADALAAQRVEEIHEQAPWMKIAVLVRRNARARSVADAIRARLPGVAISEEGASVIADAPVAGAAASLLHLLDHPGDTAALYHTATSPIAGVLGLRAGMKPSEAWSALAPFRKRCAAHGLAGALAWLFARCAGDMDEGAARRARSVIAVADAFDAERPGGRASELAGWIESRTAADPGEADIRVMTVHQSKGLEFDAVVMCELDGAWTPQTNSFLMSADAASGEEPAASVWIDGATAEYYEPAGELRDRVVQDAWFSELCGLYVGMTRAKRRLDLIVDPPPKKERSNACAAELLRLAVGVPDEQSDEEVLWRHEHGDWSSRPHKDDEPDGPAAPTLAVRFVEADRLPPERAPMRAPTGGRTVAWAVAPAGEGAVYGDAVHAACELVTWFQEGLPSATEVSAIAADAGLPGDRASQLGERFLQMLGPFEGVLSRGRYDAEMPEGGSARVFNERPFAVRTDAGELVTGRFDRLVVIRDASGAAVGAEVLDYKTDAIEPGADVEAFVAERLAAHADQLADYRAAVTRMLGLEDCRATLVLLSVGRAVTAD